MTHDVNPTDAIEHRDIETLLRRVGRQLASRDVTEIRHKGHQDLVTGLDIWAESTIAGYLAERFPNDALLSEESSSAIGYATRIWVLDPLDGTVNRANGIPFFAISLALLEEGLPARGFVYDPTHDELFAAVRGSGATLNGLPIHVAEGGVFGIAFTSKVIQGLAARSPALLVDLLERRGRLRNIGAQALQLCYVAAGRLAAAASSETKLWDNAAGALIVEEAGGRYTDLRGRSPFPLSEHAAALTGAATPCIAASHAEFEWLLPLLSPLAEP